MSFRSYIPAIIVFLVGGAFTILGSLFKILHWQLGPVNGPYLLVLGSVISIIGIGFAIVVLIIHFFRGNN